jgi:DNA repair protein RadC
MPLISALQKKNLAGQILPREKLQKFGVENLKPYELLAILLGSGTSKNNVLELSKKIIEKYALGRFSSITFKELVSIHGISTAKACTILASIQFSKIIFDKKDKPLPLIETSESAANYLYRLADFKKECLAVLYLNARNQIIHEEIISVGSLSQLLVHPREVFEPAIRYLSAYIIIAHNHPSGDQTPSNSDLEMTKQLSQAGKILGIEVLDSLVISKNGFVSII